MKINNFKSVGLISGLSFILLGCASNGLTQPPEEIVKQRAQARMDAIIADDFQTAISYTTPEYRAVYKAKDYSRKYSGRLIWTSGVLQSVQCDIDICTAKISIEFEMPQYGFKNTSLATEKWIKKSGEWYIYHDLSG